ncbi:MAG: phosphohydrolase [Candidatus Aenigmatarchaeota archaeon]|nr:MAG: phosphohydrolase [Candidatus Aenigmarchaeota archaeon]
MDKEMSIKLIEKYIKEENMRKHCLAVGAIMKELASFLNENEEKWEIIGLLHDLDYAETKNNPEKHGLITAKILKDKVDSEIIEIIKSHNFENLNIIPNKKESYGLIASDALSGLIISTALVMPSKKLSEVEVKSVKKKFKQKDFARNVSREKIMFCERLGIDKDKFFEIGIKGLQSVSKELGL